MKKTTFTNQFLFKPCLKIFSPLVTKIILFSLCWVGSICLTFSQGNNTIKLLTKQKVILDTFSIATNKPLSSLRTQVYIDYQRPNSKKFWKNLALFSGTLVLQSQLNKTSLYKESSASLLTQNNQNVFLPSISLGLLPSLWKNRPRKIPKLNLKIVHKSSDGNILNVWEKPLTSKVKGGAQLLDLSIDSLIRLGKIEISLENYSDRNVYFWGNVTNISANPVIEVIPIEEIAPYKLKRVSRYPGKLIESVVDEKIVVLQKTNKEIKGSSSFLDFTSTLSPQTFNVTNLKPKQKPVYSSATTAKESDCKALEGQVWDGTKCVFNPDVFCKANYGEDFSFNSATGYCDYNDPFANESCPSGETYQAGVGDGCPISECEDSGGVWENNACSNPSLDCSNGGGSWQEPNCQCPSGQIWDDDVKLCIINVDVEVGGQDCLIQGKVWDEATQSCISSSIECPYGYYDDGWGNCVNPWDLNQCPMGFIDDGWGGCITDGSNVFSECIAFGGQWDSNSQTCDYTWQQNQCLNIGGTWDAITRSCRLSSVVVSPSTHGRVNVNTLHTSELGKKLIRIHEGCSATTTPSNRKGGYLYEDSEGYCTFGIGHLIRRANCTSDDVSTWSNKTWNDVINDFENNKLPEFENYVKQFVTTEVTQEEFDAMVSFCFNVGVGNLNDNITRNDGFSGSSFLRNLNDNIRNGDLMYNYHDNLTRRTSEVTLFNTGQYLHNGVDISTLNIQCDGN